MKHLLSSRHAGFFLMLDVSMPRVEEEGRCKWYVWAMPGRDPGKEPGGHRICCALL